MIELSNISKSYDKGKTIVLNNLSIALRKNTMVTIQGSSGSGKSTLLNILGLLDKPDRGEYSFEGLIVRKDRKVHYLLRKKIGFIFQNYALIEHYSVEDNIIMAGQYSGIDYKITHDRMRYLIETLSLVGFERKKTKYLSGGEKQRVAIARALVKEPLLVLADEPTGNLDENNSIIINSVLKNYASAGHIVLVVTHSPHVFPDVEQRFLLEKGILKML